MRLDGKVALITGAGTGIGAAIAGQFVADGARICITGRRQETLERVAQSLPAGIVVTCAGDVTNLEDVGAWWIRQHTCRCDHPEIVGGLLSA